MPLPCQLNMPLRVTAYLPPPVSTSTAEPSKYSMGSSTAHPPVASFMLNSRPACAIKTATTILPAITTAAARVYKPKTIISEHSSSAATESHTRPDGKPLSASIAATKTYPPMALAMP